jgi:putative MFS transporter
MDERVIADPTASAVSDSPPHRARFPFLARRFPPFTPRQWRVFGISTTAGFFDTYDGALLSLALRQIQQSLRIAEAGLGAMLSAIRLGYLGALLIAPFADVFGRRRLLLYTIIGYTIFTAATAFARDEREFLIAQILARSFSGAEATVSLVILAEEVGAAVRGWAIGMQTALAICGYGLAAIVFAFIASVPYGWRGLYALALLPLLLIIPLRRILPESHRFEAEAAAGVRPRNVFEPLAAVFKTYPRRMGAIFAVWFLYAMGAAPAGMLVPKYLQEIHHWSPGRVSLLYIFGGAIGILGSMIAGRISDRAGRRRIGIAFMFAGPLFQLMVFTSGNGTVSAFWVAWVFCDQAATTILYTYGAELFPTSQRSSAGGLLMIARNAGGAAGLLGEGLLYGIAGGHWNATRILLLFWFGAALVMMLTFPETAGYELETIAPEKPVAVPDTAESL